MRCICFTSRHPPAQRAAGSIYSCWLANACRRGRGCTAQVNESREQVPRTIRRQGRPACKQAGIFCNTEQMHVLLPPPHQVCSDWQASCRRNLVYDLQRWPAGGPGGLTGNREKNTKGSICMLQVTGCDARYRRQRGSFALWCGHAAPLPCTLLNLARATQRLRGRRLRCMHSPP